MKLNSVLLTVLFLLVGEQVRGEDGPLATTPLGKVRGYWMTSRAGRRFQAYSGLPYAQPPVGKLRFQPPKPVQRWNSVRNAKEDGPYCIQMNIYELDPKNITGVEDCLYLTLYTHNTASRRPVMVHFHGGGYVGGNGARRTKPHYLMDEDVVVVDVNYRVGIMGFLSFEDEVLPGNQAMKDQVQSLRWVRENIASFGGDPNLVTIVGESAGSQSVYHHTVSPLSRGLFHRAIAESGTSYNLGSLMAPGYVRDVSFKLAELTDCKRDTTAEIVACLQNLDASQVASQIVKFREWEIDPVMTFRVVFEKGPGAFLTCPMEDWVHAPVPLLLGTTSGEGLLRTMYFIYFNMSWEWYSNNFEKVAPISLGYFKTAKDPKATTKEIRSYYLPKEHIIDNGWRKVVQMYTDSWFTIGIIEGADRHSAVSDVYFYYFDYLGEYTMAGNKYRDLVIGAYHTDEIIYLWNLPRYSNLTGEDLRMSKKLVKMWTNFAKTGSPTPEGSELKWEPWQSTGQKYLNISKTGFKMEKGLAKDRQEFWSRLSYRDNYNKCL